MEMIVRTWIYTCIVAAILNKDQVNASCDALLKNYDTSTYHGPHCEENSQGGEINQQCRFDIIDEEQSTATRIIASLRSHGYRMCFGCGNTAIHGHCPEVVVCVKEATCYKRSKGAAGYTFGCCDTRCGNCAGHCEGDFCNADASLKAFVPPTPTTTTTTTTKTTATPRPTTTTITTKQATQQPTTHKTTTPFINTWSEWSAWLSCVSTICPNQGVQARYRSCLVKTCVGQATDSRLCTTPCPQNWAEWSPWSECYVSSCGEQGFRVRTRTCQAGVGKCPGHDNIVDTCIATTCTMTCADNNYAINGNCTYWLNFQLCDPGSDVYEAIGKTHCRKTCGLCE